MTNTNPTAEKGGESQLDKIYKSDLWKEIEENFEFFNECIEDADVRDFYKRLIWELVESHAPSHSSETLEEAAIFEYTKDGSLLSGGGLFIEGFKAGANWQSQQTANALKEARERIETLEVALQQIVDLSHDKETTWANIAYNALNAPEGRVKG